MRRFAILTVAALLAMAAPVLAQSAFAPAGAHFEARLDQELNTKRLHDGDTFTLTEHDGFFHKAPPALKGAKIEGHVEHVSAAHPGHAATMSLILDAIVMADGTKAAIDAQITSLKELEPRKHHLRDTALVIGAAVAGHEMGKKHGVKHGGLMGVGTGFAIATTLKSDIDVKRGTILHLKLLEPITTVG
ncbi:MAG TPA: hypothetical protein VGT98_16640 [Candidatus Elarobacter sp.]|nr:hypothetical protein [Candidatus Elarobacter sp.]HEV2740360.1 hypothetical protein [Candidatus Elarobacter sp.]